MSMFMKLFLPLPRLSTAIFAKLKKIHFNRHAFHLKIITILNPIYVIQTIGFAQLVYKNYQILNAQYILLYSYKRNMKFIPST